MNMLKIDRVWKRRRSGASILFLLNRYITPLQFIIILDGMFRRNVNEIRLTLVLI